MHTNVGLFLYTVTVDLQLAGSKHSSDHSVMHLFIGGSVYSRIIPNDIHLYDGQPLLTSLIRQFKKWTTTVGIMAS